MNVTNVNPCKKKNSSWYLQHVEKLHIYFLHINEYIFDLLGLTLFRKALCQSVKILFLFNL